MNNSTASIFKIDIANDLVKSFKHKVHEGHEGKSKKTDEHQFKMTKNVLVNESLNKKTILQMSLRRRRSPA
jgi:hypothetical protein